MMLSKQQSYSIAYIYYITYHLFVCFLKEQVDDNNIVRMEANYCYMHYKRRTESFNSFALKKSELNQVNNS